MIVFFLLFLPLVGGDERGPPIVVEGQNEVADLDTFLSNFYKDGGGSISYQSHIIITSKLVVLVLDSFSLQKHIPTVGTRPDPYLA